MKIEKSLLEAMEYEFSKPGVVLALKFGSDPLRPLSLADLDPNSEFVHRSRKRLNQTFIYEPTYRDKVYSDDNVVCRVWFTSRNEVGKAEWLLYAYQGTYKAFEHAYEEKRKHNTHKMACDWLKVDLEAKFNAVHDYFDRVREINDMLAPKTNDNMLHIFLNGKDEMCTIGFKYNGEVSEKRMVADVKAAKPNDKYKYYLCKNSIAPGHPWLAPYKLLANVIKVCRDNWIDQMVNNDKPVNSVCIHICGYDNYDLYVRMVTETGLTHKAFSVRQCRERIDEFIQFMGMNYNAQVSIEHHKWH